ncbi:oligosaccharide flippase family protein [Rhodobacterales bacterium HKCCE2091]|nr:oligosaccharide flippase family protein [Rhodobacterales bacterium HKCCE2091]
MRKVQFHRTLVQGGQRFWRSLRRHAVGLVINPDIQAFRDLIYLLASQFGSKILGFVAFAYLARALSTESYGTLETLLAWVGIAALLVEFGMGSAAVQFRARTAGTPEAEAVIAVVPALRTVIAGICAALLVAGGLLFAPDDQARTLAFLVAASVMLHPWNQEWLLQSLEQVSHVAVGQILRIAVFAAIVLLIVRDDADLYWVGLAELLSVAAWAGYHMVRRLRSGHALSLGLRGQVSRTLIRAAAPLGMNALVWSLMQFTPTIIVGSLAGPAAAAFFAASQRLVTSLQAVSFSYHFNLFATLSRRYAEGPERMVTLSMASLRLVSWAAIGPAAAVAVVAGPVLGLIYGDRFAAAGPVLSILIFVVPTQIIAGHHRWALIAAGRSGAVLRAGLAGAAFSLAGSLALSQPLGAIGGAVASLAAALAILASSARSCARHGIPLPIARAVGVPLAAAGAAAGLALASGPAPVTRVAVVVLVYLVLMYVSERGTLFANLREIAWAKRTMDNK